MRKPTFDAIAKALAVLGTTGVVVACSKREPAASVSPEPPPAVTATSEAPGPAAPVAPAASAVSEPAAQSAATMAPTPHPAPARVVEHGVDAGVEHQAKPKPAAPKGGSAMCGATSCSPEMRKGNSK